ncbi:hypothetical protein HYU14_04360 [Candidatus Woesearchaeota archaeon]|nr:hypothetical protein [Candidatus Woesearchaeota archaeon]
MFDKIRDGLEEIIGKTQESAVTLVGNHAWDYYWELNLQGQNFEVLEVGSDGSFHLSPKLKAEELEKIISIDNSGNVIFSENLFFYLDHHGHHTYLHPAKNAGGGDKVESTTGDETLLGKLVQEGKKPIIIRPSFTARPGGGANNLAESLRGAFPEQPILYIGSAHKGTQEKPSDPEYAKHLKILNIEPILIPSIQNPQANIVITRVIDRYGNAVTSNRIIIKGHPARGSFLDYQNKESIEERLPGKKGVVVIDSLKDYPLGRYLVNAYGKRETGIAAMTSSTPPALKALAIREGFIQVFSDDDLEAHMKGYFGMEFKIRSRAQAGDKIMNENVLKALRLVREDQPEGRAARIYLTLGSQGSLCFDTDGMIYRAGVYRPEKIKDVNGAGDAYAAGVTAGEHHRSGDNPSLVIQLSAAIASSRIQKGSVDAKTVDDFLKKGDILFAEPKHIDDYTKNPELLDIQYAKTTGKKISLGQVV